MKDSALKLPQGLSVRPSTGADKGFLEQLFKSTQNHLNHINAEAEFIDMVKEQQYIAQTTSYENSYPNALFFIIEYHRERIGRLVIDFGHNEIRVVDLAFIEQARGKNLGTAVMSSVVACANKIRAPITLSVISLNTAAKALYLSLGFVTFDISPPYEQMIYTPR